MPLVRFVVSRFRRCQGRRCSRTVVVSRPRSFPVRRGFRSVRRAFRLRSGADFQRVREAGRSWANPLLILQLAPTQSLAGATRVGISASKRVGGAVVRNRAKRRVREAIRVRYARIAPGWDVVLVIRPALVEASVEALNRAVDSLLNRAGLTVEPHPSIAGGGPIEDTCAASRSA